MEKPNFHEIYGFHYIPFWKNNIFISIIAVLLAILVIATIFLLVKYLKKKTQRPLAIWEKAEQDLFKLEPSGFTTREEFKQFYFDLSETLKSYLSERYAFKLEDKTDDEVEGYLQGKLFDVAWTQDLIEILKGSRYIKFANEDALPSQAKEDWNRSLDLVNQTAVKDK